MDRQYKATIKFDTTGSHPDSKNAKNLVFTDVYHIDLNYFYDAADARNYIKNDLALVAGGGYETNTITNVTFTLEEQ